MEKKALRSVQKLVVIGGSSGSLEALLTMLPKLRADLPLGVVIVLHRNNQSDNALVELFASRTSLIVKEADEKDILKAGTIYIAPPDYHLLLEQDGSLSLDASAKVNFSRPSIDVTFSSAAAVFGKYLTGILLSGANSDGANGMAIIKKKGGRIIVQDPNEALVAYMPARAIKENDVEEVFGALELAELINSISN